jgi:hypothetical protein
MTAILYPVAADAEAALRAPLGFAARQSEAQRLAGREIAFASEVTGPAFASRDAAQAAFAEALAHGAGWTTLLPVLPMVKGRPAKLVPAKPVFKDGRRWPTPDPSLIGATQWRLSVTFWRTAAAAASPVLPARKLRRSAEGEALHAAAVKALAEQPLRPVRPQQPLDLGLFEFHPPEAPHIAMPDE